MASILPITDATRLASAEKLNSLGGNFYTNLMNQANRQAMLESEEASRDYSGAIASAYQQYAVQQRAIEGSNLYSTQDQADLAKSLKKSIASAYAQASENYQSQLGQISTNLLSNYDQINATMQGYGEGISNLFNQFGGYLNSMLDDTGTLSDEDVIRYGDYFNYDDTGALSVKSNDELLNMWFAFGPNNQASLTEEGRGLLEGLIVGNGDNRFASYLRNFESEDATAVKNAQSAFEYLSDNYDDVSQILGIGLDSTGAKYGTFEHLGNRGKVELYNTIRSSIADMENSANEEELSKAYDNLKNIYNRFGMSAETASIEAYADTMMNVTLAEESLASAEQDMNRAYANYESIREEMAHYYDAENVDDELKARFKEASSDLSDAKDYYFNKQRELSEAKVALNTVRSKIEQDLIPSELEASATQSLESLTNRAQGKGLVQTLNVGGTPLRVIGGENLSDSDKKQLSKRVAKGNNTTLNVGGDKYNVRVGEGSDHLPNNADVTLARNKPISNGTIVTVGEETYIYSADKDGANPKWYSLVPSSIDQEGLGNLSNTINTYKSPLSTIGNAQVLSGSRAKISGIPSNLSSFKEGNNFTVKIEGVSYKLESKGEVSSSTIPSEVKDGSIVKVGSKMYIKTSGKVFEIGSRKLDTANTQANKFSEYLSGAYYNSKK